MDQTCGWLRHPVYSVSKVSSAITLSVISGSLDLQLLSLWGISRPGMSILHQFSSVLIIVVL